MKRPYYGWWVVGVAMAANMLVMGSTYGAFSLLVVPVSKELGLSRANLNSALILLNFGTGIMAPVLGRMLDRFPPTRIMQVGAVLLGLSLVGLGLSRSVWLSAAVIAGPLALSMLACSTLTTTVLIARWFVAHRGRAMTLAVVGMSMGSVFVAPIMALLIASQGWRSALLIMGLGVGALLTALAFLVRGQPRPGELEKGSDSATAPDASARPLPIGALLGMAQFWWIALGAAFSMGIAQALIISVVPLALAGGTTLIQATSLVSITGASAITAKLLLSLVADRLDKILLLSGLFIAGALMNATLFVSHGYPALVVCVIMLGVTTGVVPPLLYALFADRFGPASFGTVRGLAAPVTAIVGAVAVRFGGEVYDRTGDYELMFACFVVGQLVAALLMFATRFTRPVVAVSTDPAARASAP